RSYDPKGRCYHIENSQLYNLKKAFEMLPINIQMINYDKIRNEIISLGIEIEAKLSKLKRIAIEERGKYVKLSFEYSEKMVKSIKELDASLRKYDDKTKSWTIPKNVLRILLSILKKNKIDAFYDISKIEKLKYDYENKPIQLNFVNKTNDFIELMPNEFNSTYEKLLEKYKTLNSERIIIPIDQLEDFKNFENENNIILGEDSLKSLKDTFNDVSYKLRNEKFKAIDFNSLKRKPFPHQSEIVEDMLNLKRFILADEMGLGKTYESILFAASIPYKKLVICPATLLFNWRKEILQALPNSYVRVIDSNTNIKKYEPLPEEGWLIINYELLEKFHDKLLDEKFNVLLCDEAHYIKGVDNKGFSNTKRAKNTLKIAENIPFKCALTGTPITNKPKDC
ncbi:MAG: DEAD/DEAH box helicase, partial [Streptococcus salivarius]|nr:DEAD/DEAH box helicase [Streptococcus salivarius]